MAMERTLFSSDHGLFRQAFRQFLEHEVKPHQKRWAEAGRVDREVWRKAGAAGFLCPWLSEDLGGAGGDFLHSTIIMEELAFAYESGFAMALHSDVCAPYLDTFGTPEQKRRWLPGCASGELILAIAMTEPGTGSDLAAIKTTAVRDGDDYVLTAPRPSSPTVSSATW
jgi:acyl-CoA dehydrogenase